MATNQDSEQLRLLSIFHYVVAGFAALFSMIPVIHLVMGIGMLSGKFAGNDPFARQFGLFFVAFAGFAILLGLSFSALLVIAGRYLSQRRKYMFCLVMAAFACTFIPFGTVLGIFTILVLSRESVKAEFGVL